MQEWPPTEFNLPLLSSRCTTACSNGPTEFNSPTVEFTRLPAVFSGSCCAQVALLQSSSCVQSRFNCVASKFHVHPSKFNGSLLCSSSPPAEFHLNLMGSHSEFNGHPASFTGSLLQTCSTPRVQSDLLCNPI